MPIQNIDFFIFDDSTTKSNYELIVGRNVMDILGIGIVPSSRFVSCGKATLFRSVIVTSYIPFFLQRCPLIVKLNPLQPNCLLQSSETHAAKLLPNHYSSNHPSTDYSTDSD